MAEAVAHWAGGTGHRPVLSGYQPNSPERTVFTKRWGIVVRPALLKDFGGVGHGKEKGYEYLPNDLWSGVIEDVLEFYDQLRP